MFVMTTSLVSKEVLRVYRDGTAIHMGVFSRSFDSPILDSAPHDGIVLSRTSTFVPGTYPLEKLSFLMEFNEPFTTAITFVSGRGVYLRDLDGVLQYYRIATATQGYTRVNPVTDSDIETVNVWTSGTNPTLGIHWAHDQVLAFYRADGSVRLFDVNTKTVVLDSFIDVSVAWSLDTVYQNIVSVRASDNVVQVYDLKIRPQMFSGFAGSPGTYTRYHTEALSITLEGSNSELVPDVDVEWRVETIIPIEGAVGGMPIGEMGIGSGSLVAEAKGKINPLVSKTDALGVARTTYCPPGLDWVTGDQETITTTVKV